MFEAWLKHFGNWFPGPKFDTLERVVNWISVYDPDGMEPIQIRNIELDRLVTEEELFSVMRLPQLPQELRRPYIPESTGNWKVEGF